MQTTDDTLRESLEPQVLGAMSLAELGEVVHLLVKQAQLQSDPQNRREAFEEAHCVISRMKYSVEQRQFPGRVECYQNYRVDNIGTRSPVWIKAVYEKPAQEAMRRHLEKSAMSSHSSGRHVSKNARGPLSW